MTVRSTPSTRDWLRLIGRDARSANAVALLKRFSVSIDRVQWIHGAGRLAIPKVGVYLYLWKAAEGKQADVRVLGVEFSLGGMRGGKPYASQLPFRITAGDSLERVHTRLQPRQLKIEENQKVATAQDRKHRFVVRFNSAGQLTGFSILENIPLRRVPRAT